MMEKIYNMFVKKVRVWWNPQHTMYESVFGMVGKYFK